MNKALPIIAAILLASILFFWYSKKNGPVQKITDDTIVVGTNAEYPPFTFVQNDQRVGFDIDLVKEVTKRLGKTMKLQDMSFDALIPQAQLGKIHIIAAGISPSLERAKRLFFTKPYISGDPLVIISLSEKEPLKTISDLTDKKIVVNQGFTADFYLSNIEGPKLMRLATLAEAFLALNSGRAQAFVTAEKAAQPFLEQHGIEKFHIHPLEETSDDYALAISKKYPELHEKVEQILTEMVTDGTMDNLKKKWKL